MISLRKPGGPRYYASQTLLGGEPDVNRRTIIDLEMGGRAVVGFNREMGEWTADRARVFKMVLDAMNSTAEKTGPLV